MKKFTIIKNFVKINRLISSWFLGLVNKKFGEIDGSENYFNSELNSIDLSSSKVLEIGGSQRPVFNKERVLFYAGLDIDNQFNWADYYHKYYNEPCTDPITDSYDFIFSKYLLEHVDNNQKTFQNIINSLTPSGKSIHIFPLGFHPYSILTRLISNRLQRKLITILRPHSDNVGGYPLFFNMCNSISLNRYFSKRNEITWNIKYFYGADDYFAFFFPLFLFSMLFNRICYLLRIRLFASNAVLVLTKIKNDYSNDYNRRS